jgi:hypothetical protein
VTSPDRLPLRTWIRISALILGIALILWLPIEDVNVNQVLFFANAVCAWWAARFLLNISPQNPTFLWRHVLIGLLAGLAVSPVAVFLVAFKSGLHGHGIPDFSSAQILDVLARSPVWIVAGSLLGLGVALARLSRQE